MASNRILLDTNAVSDVMNGFPQVLEVLQQYDEYAVPSIVLGELYFMAENSARRVENYGRVEEFMKGIAVVEITRETARY
jgi:tRNA(fMet)-specific endonuclease VapC